MLNQTQLHGQTSAYCQHNTSGASYTVGCRHFCLIRVQIRITGQYFITVTPNERGGFSNHSHLDCFPVIGWHGKIYIKVPYQWPFVRVFHCWPVVSPHKGTVTPKAFQYHEVLWQSMSRLIYCGLPPLPFNLCTNPECIASVCERHMIRYA